MGGLIKAEFRKIFTTKLWWALLIPTVVIALGWSWATAALGSSIADSVNRDANFQRLGVTLDHLPLAVLALARSINISTIFPMLVGGLALSSEIRHRTITTTYLTSANRVSVLSTKLVVYTLIGAMYGVAIAVMVSLGALIGARGHSNLLPSAGAWLGITGAGILETVLWTLLAVGVGALFGNVIGTVVTLLLYSILVENLLSLFLPGHGPGFLPNQAADGITSSLAAQTFLDAAPPVAPAYRDDVVNVVRAVAGARGVFDWWLSALIFLGYAVVFFGAGWIASQKRDVA